VGVVHEIIFDCGNINPVEIIASANEQRAVEVSDLEISEYIWRVRKTNTI